MDKYKKLEEGLLRRHANEKKKERKGGKI